MKNTDEIVARVRGLLCAELDRRLITVSQRLPHLCVHNHRQPLDQRKEIEGERNSSYNKVSLSVVPTIGLCMLGAETPEDWQGTICEDPIDAKKCPLFTPGQGKEAVLADFKEQVSDPEWLKVNMPEVLELLWVAGLAQTPSVPFWKRILVWFTRIELEPVAQVPDLTPLLTTPNENIRT